MAGSGRGVRLAILLFGVLVLASGGCRTLTQYERVAKDWSQAVRASQVIPVYPLTEDLRPGDVFLVRLPTSKQVKEYKERGYLTLDDHRVRLRDLDFTRVYHASYYEDSFGNTPHPRPVRPAATTGAITDDQPRTALTDAVAPRAAFPSYSFKVSSGGSLNLAVPVKGVPVGLSFMGGQAATGSLSIFDARTYMADHSDLMAKLQAWARTPEVRAELESAVKASRQNHVFLRVVKRVYSAGGVDVRLTSQTAGSAGARVGTLSEQVNNPEVDLETFKSGLAKQQELLRALNSAASTSGIGGSVRFNWATDRSVSLREAFDVQLVFGYLGMDVPVFSDGSLGLPVPTFERLDPDLPRPVTATLGDLRPEQERLVSHLNALQTLAGSSGRDPYYYAARVVRDACQAIEADEFQQIAAKAASLLASSERPAPGQVMELVNEFWMEAITYTAAEGDAGIRYARLNNALEEAMSFFDPNNAEPEEAGDGSDDDGQEEEDQ